MSDIQWRQGIARFLNAPGHDLMDDNGKKVMNVCSDFVERIFAGSIDLDAYLNHIGRYMFTAPFIQGRVVLDAGCGTGYGSYWMSRDGAKTVVGIDVDPGAVGYASRNYKSTRLAYVIADAGFPPLKSDNLDLIVSFEMIEHLRNPLGFLMWCHNILDPGGILIVSTPNRKRFSLTGQNLRNPFHVKEYTSEEFKGIIQKASFSIVHVCYQGRIQQGQKVKVTEKLSRLLSRLRFVPETVRNLIRLVQEVILCKVSFKNVLTYHRSKPSEVVDVFLDINLPPKYRVLYISENDNPDFHRFFVLVAKK